MKTKTIRCYEDVADKIMLLALEISAERGKLISTADVLKDMYNDYQDNRKDPKRSRKASDKSGLNTKRVN